MPDTRTIKLEQPIKRGEQEFTSVSIRKPASGELRGLSLMQLSQLDYATLETLIPRISDPRLDKAEVQQLDPADFMAIGAEVMEFFLPASVKEAVSRTA